MENNVSIGHEMRHFKLPFASPVPPRSPGSVVSLRGPGAGTGHSGEPVLLGDVQGHELKRVHALHQPALALADPRHVHLQELVRHSAPQDV